MSEPINWQQLTPEQRDMLVAEKIMGWQPQECEGSISWDHGIWRCLECGKDGTRHEETVHNVPTPRYTTSLDAAWKALLITGLGRMGDIKILTRELLGTDEHDLDPFYILGFVTAWTPETICIACLRACGIEVINER